MNEMTVCLGCGKKEKGVVTKPCDCGSLFFAIGKNFNYTLEKGVVCNCGARDWKPIMVDNPSRNKKFFQCSNCKNIHRTFACSE